MPNIRDHKELMAVLSEVGAFESQGDMIESLNQLRTNTGSETVNLGIKKVLLAVGEAKQDVDPVGRFADVVAQQMAASMD